MHLWPGLERDLMEKKAKQKFVFNGEPLLNNKDFNLHIV